MYLKQEMYYTNGDILKTILIPNNMCQDDYLWILGPRLFRVIRLTNSQMQASIVLLTNEFGVYTVNEPSMAIVKIEPSDDDVIVLLYSNEEFCHVVDLSDTSFFSYRTKSSNPVLDSVDFDKTPHNSSYMKLLRHGVLSQRPPLHHFSSSSGFNIVDTLKMTKSRRRSRSNLTAIDFDSIDVRNVKYFPPSFDGDVIFILPPIVVDNSNTYGVSWMA